MAPSSQPATMLHPAAPDEVMGDQHLYAAWCYRSLSAEFAAAVKARHVSVAVLLVIFRDEWRRVKEAALHARADPPDRKIIRPWRVRRVRVHRRCVRVAECCLRGPRSASHSPPK